VYSAAPYCAPAVARSRIRFASTWPKLASPGRHRPATQSSAICAVASAVGRLRGIRAVSIASPSEFSRNRSSGNTGRAHGHQCSSAVTAHTQPTPILYHMWAYQSEYGITLAAMMG
jgi:hypothetical protein